MNNKPYYFGFYGRTHREMYEDALKGVIDRSAAEAVKLVQIDMKPGMLEIVLEKIFHTERKIEQKVRNYHPSEEQDSEFFEA
jgi:hypothetical protein